MGEIKRYGLVKGRNISADKVKAYLPSGYEIEGTVSLFFPWGVEVAVVIGGRDYHGWTLDRYIIPRLGSGLMTCEEIDLSHPVMAQLPAFP